ncbi:ABC transporter permease [Halodesulfovibrio sp.]|jgi:peptide/nickel transport system permease protein|uniref:ABC transporter permease n=1 Tax=Halodesulfovibrio sp. TaxID=1912772 RepID=UPI0025E8C0D9|nr:ABC transporter permease [Halodesulfovibrio sp.]MCT4535821.1 ABC transporter permease [Halodesulfovibrio sp.]
MWQKFKDTYFWYSFRRDPVAVGSFIILVILLLMAILAPVLATQNPYDGATIDLMDAETPPMWTPEGLDTFWLGTDAQGRDIWSTILYGTRISLLIGLGAVALQSFLGIIIGLTAGYKGGRVDTFLMRVADVQLSFSSYMVAIFFGAILQAALGVSRYADVAVPFLIFVIGFSEWPQYARTVRASVLAEKKKEYVEAARVIGLRPMRIMFRHILPNTLTPVLVISTVQVANAVMSEAALSFLGLGMPVNQPSLGSLIKSGFAYFMSGSWWITLFPGLVLVLLVLSINLLGDWLRDFLNPKLYKD